MEREKEYLLHLLGAYLRGDEPQIQPDADWERLRQLARIHNLAGVLAYLAMKYPVCQDRQAQAAHRKFCMSTIAGFAQRGSLAEAFSQTLSDHGIDHIMMKGFVIRDFYPVPEFRSYGDIDLVIRKDDRVKCHELMKQLGFAVETDWEPVYSYTRENEFYEIHTELLETDVSAKVNCREYFHDPWAHVRCAERNRFEFEPEYHFLYLLTHLAKHVVSTGAGIRMYLDVAVFVQHYRNSLNWGRIEEELESLYLRDFANVVLYVVQEYFGIPNPLEAKPVNPKTIDLFLEITMDGGVFGMVGQRAGVTSLKEENRSRGEFSRVGTMMNRLFPAADAIQNRYTYLQKYPWLLPAAWVHRLVKTRGRFHDHTVEARGILSANKEAVQKLSRVYEAIGL